MSQSNNYELATLGGGCFWCVEAVLQRLKGVHSITSGYSGGNAPGHPTYREVCSGLTGHAEVVQVSFDPTIISYQDLLGIFLTSHDPTTLNRQGGDVGTQYRSVIFYHNDKQKEIAQDVVKKLGSYFDDPIVTEISPLDKFYPAESYHQDYYNNNQSQGYCAMVITPKIVKLKQHFADRLKPLDN
ncbi:peptide methionine sulfoxide reductase [Galbibacter marinus]|uniref:Peptide methionine sulfoxide reductase MsrA n=1 Tax=Galbibacter marinus TaxID=555500 RepID=K2Q7J8_9FLAO|nr:peptide-methionine (S)-S-oxide reductase MsrA [Galbibacter marinus]EKF56846.1 peptide methionine sulfoxide reductase [Galbibacter marinus]